MHQYTRYLRNLLIATAASTMAMTIATGGATEPVGEWRSYAGTNAGAKYAALDQVDKDTVKNLRIAWRQSSMPREVRRGRGTVAVPTNYQVTPLMVDGLLYATAGDGSVAALHPGTGAVVWTFVPPDLVKAELDAVANLIARRAAALVQA